MARDISILRRIVELKRCADLLDAPVSHNAKTVRDRHRLFLIMGYVHESMIELALQAIKFNSHLLSQSGVKSRDRLIHQICFRITHERPPDRNALSLSAGKMCRELV